MSIKFIGRLLNLGTTDKCGRIWAENCKLEFPEKVPVIYNFNEKNAMPIGIAEIFRDEKGLSCEVVFYDPIINQFLMCIRDPIDIYIGGEYATCKCDDDGEQIVIHECSLVSVSIIPTNLVADENLKLERRCDDGKI